jgi:hypothetical protein
MDAYAIFASHQNMEIGTKSTLSCGNEKQHEAASSCSNPTSREPALLGVRIAPRSHFYCTVSTIAISGSAPVPESMT